MKTMTLRIDATTGGMPPGAIQAVLDALDCQIAVLTASGEVIAVNEAWRKMAESDMPCATRVPPGENYLQACNARDSMSREAQQAAAGVGAVLARRTRHFSLEYPCHQHGKELWFEMNATACEILGSPHALVVHRSISCCRAAQEQEQEHEHGTEDELRALLTRKEEFLATLLHELRNPLAPIASALEMLGRRAYDTQSVARARGIIQRQLRQITRLVDDLFDVSRSKRDDVEMRCAPLDIADVIPIAIESAQPLIDERRHTLTATIVPNRFIARADVTRLAQVLTNILVNAAKYTPPAGHISIITERTETDVLVHVRDSGIGIAPEHIGRVFELFAQASSPPEARMGGLGIGLALARELMRLQGGTIKVRSAGLGRGSEFTVSLPRADDGVR